MNILSGHTALSVCFLSMLLLVGGRLSAQKSLTATQILDKTSAAMRCDGGLTATFSTHQEGGIPSSANDKVYGSISIMGERYIIRTPSVSTWYNGKKQWTLVEENREVSVTTPTAEELQVSSPTAFLDMYKSGFNLSAKSTMLGKKTVWEVSLRPKKKGQEPSLIIVSIDKEKYYPLQLRIRNEGEWTSISTTGFKAHAGLSAKDFSFPAKDYPGYEILEY